MARKKKPETLEALQVERNRSEKELRYWENQESIRYQHRLEENEPSNSASGPVCWNHSWENLNI